MIICIDFDGTCVTHEYPKVGKDIGAIPILKRIIKDGHKLILFTMRSYKEGISPVTKKLENGGLTDAVKWFADNDIPLYGINVNPGQSSWTNSPKAYAQLYIDDAGIGCPLIYNPEISQNPYADWVAIEKLLEDRGVI